MSLTSSRQGETTSWVYGGLRRRLPAGTAFTFVNGGEGGASGVITKRCRLLGVNTLLNIGIAAAIVADEGRAKVIYPALPGTINVIPFVKPPDTGFLFMQPLSFVPQNIPRMFVLAAGFDPNGGPFPLEGVNGLGFCDGADIEITVDAAQYVGAKLDGDLVLQVTADYNGHWWDTATISNLLGGLSVTELKPDKINTT